MSEWFAILGLVATSWAGEGAQVGFQQVTMAAPGTDGVPVAVWYPTRAAAIEQPVGLFRQTVARDAEVDGRSLPLIVVSHGNGGSAVGHCDTALALAEAGFVVAALEHSGDNYRDHARATDLGHRSAELHDLVDYMLTEWPQHDAVDGDRVGAFGFSSGGFTVLALAGGAPDLSRIDAHCASHPSYFDCQLLRQGAPRSGAPTAFAHDPRVRALVVAAPALGFTLSAGLGEVDQPVQIWRAQDDRILPAPDYAEAVHEALPDSELHLVRRADHWAFLAPCSEALAEVAPQICADPPRFDREAFHRRFNRAVTRFFATHLR